MAGFYSTFSDTWGSFALGRARGQNLVLYENSKSIGWRYMCLSGHFLVNYVGVLASLADGLQTVGDCLN